MECSCQFSPFIGHALVLRVRITHAFNVDEGFTFFSFNLFYEMVFVELTGTWKCCPLSEPLKITKDGWACGSQPN